MKKKVWLEKLAAARASLNLKRNLFESRLGKAGSFSIATGVGTQICRRGSNCDFSKQHSTTTKGPRLLNIYGGIWPLLIAMKYLGRERNIKKQFVPLERDSRRVVLHFNVDI